MTEENQAPSKETSEPQHHFAIQRIYLKDASFEAPNTPDIFQLEWKPENKLGLDTKSRELGGSLYEVSLRLTLEVKNGTQIAFICEIEQSGIFQAENMESSQLAHCLGAFCPNILFPYAREAISNLVNKGSFPQVNLSPVNFDALFMDHLKKQMDENEQVN